MTRERRRWTRGTPEVRRGEILDAAQALIITVGYDTMTMSQVADRAGLGKGTVYLYFDSKQQLLEGLQARYWHAMLDAARAGAARRAPSWRARLDHLLDDLLDFGVEHDELFHALFSEIPSADPQSIDAFDSIVTDLLRGGQEAGEFHIVDFYMTASLIGSVTNSMTPQLIDAPMSTRRKQVRLFKELLHRVVGSAA